MEKERLETDELSYLTELSSERQNEWQNLILSSSVTEEFVSTEYKIEDHSPTNENLNRENIVIGECQY